MKKLTEQDSKYRNLEQMTTHDILTNMNREDKLVALAVATCIPEIAALVEDIHPRMQAGGRLFYIGAGTSGRLGILDASECPPTFGVPHDLVVGLISGGDGAIRKAVEYAEDSVTAAYEDLLSHGVDKRDTVIGIAASGTTPYVIGGLSACQDNGILTGSITCNPNVPILAVSDHSIVCEVGPEFITGSTRLKSGTAQKMILNMISTSVMIRLGRVLDNKMVDMQLSNQKLVIRGTHMIVEATGISEDEAKTILLEQGSVRSAVDFIRGRN